MSNRKQPFGYRISNGEIVIFPAEQKLVQYIFEEYLRGASFNELTNLLRNQDVPYDNGRLWNKNMVARVLGDKRYTGEYAYPRIVSESIYAAASAKRASKVMPNTQTEAHKVLKRICDGVITVQVENQVLYLINCLISDPVKIRQVSVPRSERKSEELKAELDKLMIIQPIDEARATELIYKIAAAQYEEIGNSEYETERMRRLFLGLDHMPELDAEVLKSCISKIFIKQREVSILLKNGQIIGKADL